MIHHHQLKIDGEILPTMYDLPSENPEEPGVPDQFHAWQSELLTQTFVPPGCDSDRIMIASDMNLYYDLNRPRSYKRPDWYAVLDVPHLYGDEREPRMSYVIWQEKAAPSVVVELLSPSTEDEDMGRTQREPDEPPTKWEVYEQILGIPYYAVFSRYTDKFRAFKLDCGMYNEMVLPGRRLWIPELKLGLGVWNGRYHSLERKWLRWYDADNNWISTPAEQAEQLEKQLYLEKERTEQEAQRAEQEAQRAEQEAQRAEQEAQRAERLVAQLRAAGIEPDR